MGYKNKLNNQETFNTVVNHLRKQNGRSMASTEEGDIQCAYRGVNGDKCAIGCLIKDEYYHEKIEGLDIGTFLVRDAVAKSGCLAELGILSDLQSMHDNCEPSIWETEFSKLAVKYNVIMPEAVTTS